MTLCGDVVLVDHLRRLFEVGGQRQLEEVAAAEGAVRPPLEGGALRLLLALGPADVDLPVGGLVLAGAGAEALDRLRDRRGADEAVAARAASSADFIPATATRIGGGSSGRV